MMTTENVDVLIQYICPSCSKVHAEIGVCANCRSRQEPKPTMAELGFHEPVAVKYDFWSPNTSHDAMLKKGAAKEADWPYDEEEQKKRVIEEMKNLPPMHADDQSPVHIHRSEVKKVADVEKEFGMPPGALKLGGILENPWVKAERLERELDNKAKEVILWHGKAKQLEDRLDESLAKRDADVTKMHEFLDQIEALKAEKERLKNAMPIYTIDAIAALEKVVMTLRHAITNAETDYSHRIHELNRRIAELEEGTCDSCSKNLERIETLENEVASWRKNYQAAYLELSTAHKDRERAEKDAALNADYAKNASAKIAQLEEAAEIRPLTCARCASAEGRLKDAVADRESLKDSLAQAEEGP